MTALQIAVCDFWPGHQPLNDSIVSRFLRGSTVVPKLDSADLVISSVYGNRHASARCTTLSLSYEPRVTRFRQDWTLDWRYRDHETHCRLPYWAVTVHDQLGRVTTPIAGPDPAARAFCNFIFWNHGCRERNEFFDALNRRKRVDSLGRVRQNATDPRLLGRHEADAMASKRLVQSGYRFTVAFENSEYEGYTTEKMIDAWLSDTVPIYWGNPAITREFPPGSYLSLYEAGSIDALVDAVLDVENSPALYELYRRANPLRTGLAVDLATAHISALEEFVPRVLDDAAAQRGSKRVSRARAQARSTRGRIDDVMQRVRRPPRG